MKLHISSHPKFNEVRAMFASNPNLKISVVSREFNISRLTLAGWVYDIRSEAGAIIRRGLNRISTEEIKTNNTRRCLKCKQQFDVTENYYRCKHCRSLYE